MDDSAGWVPFKAGLNLLTTILSRSEEMNQFSKHSLLRRVQSYRSFIVLFFLIVKAAKDRKLMAVRQVCH